MKIASWVSSTHELAISNNKTLGYILSYRTVLEIFSLILTTLRRIISDKIFYNTWLWIDEKVTVYVQAAEPAHQTNYVIQKS